MQTALLLISLVPVLALSIWAGRRLARRRRRAIFAGLVLLWTVGAAVLIDRIESESGQAATGAAGLLWAVILPCAAGLASGAVLGWRDRRATSAFSSGSGQNP